MTPSNSVRGDDRDEQPTRVAEDEPAPPEIQSAHAVQLLIPDLIGADAAQPTMPHVDRLAEERRIRLAAKGSTAKPPEK